MLKLLNDSGGQDLATIILECENRSTTIVDPGRVHWLLAEMVKSGDVFTDGTIFASHPDEIASGSLVHCTKFLIQAFEYSHLQN